MLLLGDDLSTLNNRDNELFDFPWVDPWKSFKKVQLFVQALWDPHWFQSDKIMKIQVHVISWW